MVCGAAPSFGAKQAVALDGSIFVLSADGSRLQVTSSLTDSQPDLALDGTKVVFVRKTDIGSEIWIAGVGSGASPARPLLKPPLRIMGRTFSQFFNPKFSPDGETVFFLIPFAATTQAILRILISNPEPKLVAAALNFVVVLGGQYRGDLVAQIRKAKLAPGFYEWYWLLTPDGKEIGIVGQDEHDVARFME